MQWKEFCIIAATGALVLGTGVGLAVAQVDKKEKDSGPRDTVAKPMSATDVYARLTSQPAREKAPERPTGMLRAFRSR